MRALTRWLAIAFLGGLLAGPAMAQKITIDYDPTVNFAKLRTYTWADVHATDSTVEQRILTAANRTLALRYMTEGGKNSDVTLTAIEASKDPQELAAFYAALTTWTWQRGWGTGFMDGIAAPENLPVGTLIVDMYDTSSHRLLWRGTVTLPVADATAGEADQHFDKAVTQLLGKYPPKRKK